MAMFGCHPPGDVNCTEYLMRAAIGEWVFETESSKANFQVIYPNSFDKLAGGLMNILLGEDGQHFQNAHVREGRSWMIGASGDECQQEFILRSEPPVLWSSAGN
jgi:hypothetical protein